MPTISIVQCLRAALLLGCAYGTTLPENAKRPFTVGQGVHTSSGLVLGQPASSRTLVSEYLGIPFAQPPVGNLRFAAPRAFSGTGTINATAYSPDCPANLPTSPGNSTGLAGPNAVRLFAEINQVGKQQSEDCLTLNIWTKPQTGHKRKAVLFWIYGGGWQTGNAGDPIALEFAQLTLLQTNNPAFNGQYFADSEDVVIVTANYRVNVFGFPGLPGMAQNVGLLDQRLAIEWVRDNIAAFGGDPTRITIFGQSAGAASVDYYSYAWTSDPIVNAFITESGTATSFSNPAPPNNTASWFAATSQLSCGGASAGIAATLACMRTKPFRQILNATASPPGVASLLGQFGPTIDNRLVFPDYAARASAGQFTHRPYLTGNNDYEAGLFKQLAAEAGIHLPALDWAIYDLVTFSCPAAHAALARSSNGVPTWRYRYYADFPNLRLTSTPDSGAWHGAEMYALWQTAASASGDPDTPAEKSISRYVAGAWAAFAKDPTSALERAPFSWPRYEPNGNTLIRLGYDNETEASSVDPVTYDLACPVIEAVLADIPGGFLGLPYANASTLAPLGQFGNLTAMGGGNAATY